MLLKVEPKKSGTYPDYQMMDPKDDIPVMDKEEYTFRPMSTQGFYIDREPLGLQFNDNNWFL
jgi:hypothetical protein